SLRQAASARVPRHRCGGWVGCNPILPAGAGKGQERCRIVNCGRAGGGVWEVGSVEWGVGARGGGSGGRGGGARGGGGGGGGGGARSGGSGRRGGAPCRGPGRVAGELCNVVVMPA